MRRTLNEILLAVVIAVVVGFGSALAALELNRSSSALTIGPWRATVAGPQDNPYARAAAAVAEDLPLASDEGIAFIARTDSDGRSLDGLCAYEIAGRAPAARLWSLTVYDSEDSLMASPSGRTSFHSQEILREADGSFTISASVEPRSGNWLPVRLGTSLTFVFRLYDSPLGPGLVAANRPMPVITSVDCR